MLNTFFGGFIFLIIFAAVLVILISIFWICMLIDCLKRDFKKDIEKIAWVLVLIFLHILGAIIYYFVVKVGDKENSRKKKK